MENQANNSVTQLISEPVSEADQSVMSQVEQQPLPAGEAGKQNNFLTILLSVLLFVSVTISGFFAFQTQRLNEELIIKNEELKQTTQNQIESITEPVMSESPVIDQTADWKIYTNSKYGFTFKYPKDSFVKADMVLIDGSIEFNNFIFLLEKTDDTLISYVNRLKDTNGAMLSTKTVNTFEAIEWIGSYKNAPAHYVSTINNDLVFNLGITATENMTRFVSDETKLLDQILSTFIFTN